MTAAAFAAYLAVRRGWLGRTGRPQPVSPALAMVVLAWHLLVTPSLIRLALWAAGFTPGASNLRLRERALELLVAYGAAAPVVALWVWLRRRPSERRWAEQARDRVEAAHPARRRVAPTRLARATLIALAGLLIAWPIVMLTAEVTGLIYEYFTGAPRPTIAHRTLGELAAAPTGDPWLLAAAGVLVILVPVLEEVVYRGAIQGVLRDFTISPWPAILLTALLFGVMHIGPADGVAVPGLIVFGIALGIVYERSGTLLAPIMMHGLFNLGNIALMLLIRPEA